MSSGASRLRGIGAVATAVFAVAARASWAAAAVSTGAGECDGGGMGCDGGEDALGEINAELEREYERQRRLALEDAHAADAAPKEIFVHCPQEPTVRINDLAQSAVERDECLVLHITAPQLDAHLTIKCDGAVDREFFE